MRKADNLTTILCHCHEIWELNFLEPSGPLQASNGTALPLFVVDWSISYTHIWVIFLVVYLLLIDLSFS